MPVIQNFYGRFEENLEEADAAIPKLDIKKSWSWWAVNVRPAAIPLVYREGRYGRFIGCSTFPTCRYTEQILNLVGVQCAFGGGEMVERRTKKGRTWYSCSKYPECQWTSWKKPLPDPDGQCADGLLVQVNKETTDCTICGLKEGAKQPEPKEAKAR